jgi:hypothetical protein
MDRQHRLQWFRLRLGQLRSQRPKRNALGFGAVHQVQQAQAWNPPGVSTWPVLEYRGIHRTVDLYLSQMHGLIAQYFK